MTIPAGSLYRKVAEDIKAAIAAGAYPPGATLPSESELAERYSVSRGTVRQAFAVLRADGVIASRRGARRVVIGGPRVQSFGELLSFSRWARAIGEVPTGRVVSMERRPATDSEAARLGLPEGGIVYFLVRVRLLSGRPVMLERAAYPEKVGVLVAGFDLATDSIAERLEELDVAFTDAEHVIDAVAASAEDARWLKVRAGAPLLRERRFTTDRSGTPVEWSDDRYLGTETAFSVRNSVAVNALSRTSPRLGAPSSSRWPAGLRLSALLAVIRKHVFVDHLAIQVYGWLYLLAVINESGRVVIVGGGILGTMHAVMARRRGLAVTHLEREQEGRGASVRNFGLVWVSGRRAGPELALALRARELWESIAADAPGTGFRPAGSLTVASTEAELAVMREAAGLPDAKQREFEVLSPGDVREVNPALRGEFAGGLWCRADAIVEPRVALPALRAWLASPGGPGYEWLPGREAVEVEPNGVRDHLGQWHRGDLVVLCTGANFTGVAGPHLAAAGALASTPNSNTRGAAGAGLRRVRLQMLQTRPFAGRLTTSVADGDSLRYYPAYDVPSLASLPPQAEVAAANRAQLLMVQRLDGSLTIGDTHEYDEPFAFDVDEGAYDHLVARAAALLGTGLPRVQRRWAGVYSEVTGTTALYHRSAVSPGVVLVTGPGGRGMTCSPAIAEETFL